MPPIPLEQRLEEGLDGQSGKWRRISSGHLSSGTCGRFPTHRWVQTVEDEAMLPEGLIEELLHPPVDEFTAPSRRLGQRVFRAALSVALLGAGIFTGLVATVALPSTAEGAVTGQVSQATDPNWAGYIALGAYQAVSTTLVVPTATCAPGEN